MSLSCPTLKMRWSKRSGDEIWLEAPIGQHWIAAHRLFSDGERIVVGELRVFPAEPGRRWAGEWSAAKLGQAAAVPAGGLTARLLRQVRMTDHVHCARQIMKRHQFPRHLLAVDVPAGGDDSVPRRGRPPLSTKHYAQVAVDYADFLSDYLRPVQEIARLHKVSRSQAGAWVRRARQLGYLTQTKRGATGGEATDAARLVLKSKSRRASRPK